MHCQKCDTKNPEVATFCANCGTQLVAIQKQEAAPQTRLLNPQPARRSRRGLIKSCLLAAGALFALVVACAGISATIEGDDRQTAAVKPDPTAVLVDGAAELVDDEAAEAEALPIAKQQAAFIQTVESFYRPYREAKNELQGFEQRSKRREALATLMPGRAVRGWTGTLESLDTSSNGNAYITIRPDGTESITISTWNNALRDVGTNSMILPGSHLYDRLADMSAGDRVAFSGTFVAGDEDHIAEGSLTEAGSMTTPGFVMVFSDVTRQE